MRIELELKMWGFSFYGFKMEKRFMRTRWVQAYAVKLVDDDRELVERIAKNCEFQTMGLMERIRELLWRDEIEIRRELGYGIRYVVLWEN